MWEDQEGIVASIGGIVDSSITCNDGDARTISTGHANADLRRGLASKDDV
jgi:hypothetical protein